MSSLIEKIISGGQTGADRDALDIAIELGIPHGGWLPKGRKTEEGPLPEKYQLEEMRAASYEMRTVKNVLEADGTLFHTGSSQVVRLHKTRGSGSQSLPPHRS
jgi:hypothetical protein